MNTQTRIEAVAPFTIGQGLSLRSGRRAWIVAVEPVQLAPNTSRLTLVIGGPVPMASINWNVRLVDADSTLSTHDEHTIARMLEQSAHVAPITVAEAAALDLQAHEKRDAARERLRQEQADRDAAREASKLELQRLAPTWAKAAIVAELHEDDSDSMTDYHNHRTTRRVVIGWSKHERDLFAEMRKAAATFDPTADLAGAPADAEHREKYSMGAGFYLKRGWRDSSGWCVKKRSVRFLAGDVLEFSDAARGIDAAPTAEPEQATPTGGNAAGLFTISEHVHTKKGFRMWICAMADRVERADFDRFLAAAKALGGWYARAWAGTPAGFAFKSEAAALQFTGQGAGPVGPTPTGGASEPRKAPASARAVNPADKLRAMADGLQAAIDDKFRDRRANTPKQQRQAAEARQDGGELERAQRIMRALADRHDAGTVPPVLQSVTTKASILRLAKEEIDRRNAGYYDAGIPTGRPYEWGDAQDREQAAAAWLLIEGARDTKRWQAEELRQKIDALKFAKIPGYFPTPGPLVARMIREADLLPGSRVLEPSAGSGAIAEALREAGHSVECVERHGTLCDILAAKGLSVIRGDFLEIGTAGTFDAVLMNPPFENGQDLAHVRKAWEAVRAGGSLVAIMGAGVNFRCDRKYADFRAWVEEIGGTFDEIPAGAFKESGTGVASVLFHAIKA